MERNDAERADDPEDGGTGSEGHDWQAVATYGARYEVEIPVQQLEHAGIPVMVKGEEAGIWGPAYAGPTSQGLTLLVPADRADEARSLLEID